MTDVESYRRGGIRATAAVLLLALASTASAQQPSRGHLSAQSPAPLRYKSVDGVEMIVGRSEATNLEPHAAITPPKPETAVASSSSTSYRIPGHEQAARDAERDTVLTAELLKEQQALQVERQALQSPRVALDLNALQMQALRDSLGRHEENVKALIRERSRGMAGSLK